MINFAKPIILLCCLTLLGSCEGISTGDGSTETDPLSNSALIADAGFVQRVEQGKKVTLDGTSSSGSGGTIVGYNWIQAAGTPKVSISNSTLAVATFTAPKVKTNTPLTFELTVTDDEGGVDANSVIVTITPSPAPPEPGPMVTDARQFIWGHSLINHSEVGGANKWTNVPIWINEFATAAGYSYAVGGAFGFGAQHANTLPPTAQWSLPGVSGLEIPENITTSGWAAGDINNVMFTPANYRQKERADAVTSNWPDIITETTNKLFSFAENANPGNARYMIYEHWTDMGSHTTANFTSTYPTPVELEAYWAYNESYSHAWFIDYHDAMMRDYPSLDVKLLPVGYILGKLLRGTLSSIPAVDLYQDNAPHGKPSLYFLAGLITYMGIYGEKVPTTYTVPKNIHNAISTNFSKIINKIWSELINFRDADQNSRVFPHEMAREGLGGNLNGISDFSSSETFIDLFKMARGPIPNTDTTFDTEEKVITDADGWPTRLPTNENAEEYRRIHWFWARHAMWPGGRYVLTWDGTGNFIYTGGISVVSSSSNRVVLDLPPAMEGGIIVDAITEGNYPRNMRLVPEAYEFTDTIANPFNPAWLETLTIYEAYRFMDWAETNNSSQVSWSDRPSESSASYINGVPIEVMVKLMNRTQKNGWFCIPHQADDNYVKQMAKLVLNTLDSNLTVQIEYSNEVWNYLFKQSTFAATQANTLWGVGDTFQNRINYYGYRANQTVGIWKSIWAGQQDRVKGVLSSQADVAFSVNQALTCPLAGGGCNANIDQLGIAPYFGIEMGTDNSRMVEFESATITEVLDELENTHLPTALKIIDDNVTLANKNGLELVAYEGGQHMLWLGEPNPKIDNLFIAANKDPRIGDILTTYYDGWKARTNGIYMHFSHIGINSKFGSWSSMEHLQNFYDTPRPPKRLAIEKW
jgi:hypothetical protein